MPLPSNLITFNPLERNFIVFSEDISKTKISPLFILVKGYLQNHVTNYSSFNLYLNDPCPSAIIRSTLIETVFFQVGDYSSLIVTLPTFSSNLKSKICGTWTRTITDFLDTPLDDKVFIPSTDMKSLNISAENLNDDLKPV